METHAVVGIATNQRFRGFIMHRFVRGPTAFFAGTGQRRYRRHGPCTPAMARGIGPKNSLERPSYSTSVFVRS